MITKTRLYEETSYSLEATTKLRRIRYREPN